jgi:hypothetical protein
MPRPDPLETPAAKGVSWLGWAGIVLAGVIYVAMAGFHLANGRMNIDEGFYAAAARAVWQGELPYRDFGYTQAPLLPYANGAAMKLVGFGLFEQRMVNGFWALVALALAARLLARRTAVAHAILVVALFAVTPAWLYFIHLGKTYGFVALVAMAATTVWLEWAPGGKKAMALALLCVAGIGSRLPSAPFFALLWLASLRDVNGFNLRRAGIALAALAGAAAVLLLPFYLAAPEQARFWAIDFFRVSVPLRKFHVRWQEMVALSPVVLGLFVAVAVTGLARRRRWPWKESSVAVASLAAFLANVLPQGAYDEYGVSYLLPLATAVLLLAPVPAWPRAALAGLAVTLLVVQVAAVPALYRPLRKPGSAPSWSAWLPLSGTPFDFKLREKIRGGREFVEKEVAPGQPFYGPAIILAIEADRPIPRRLRMGSFTVTSDMSPEEADRMHLITYNELAVLFRSPDVNVVGMYFLQVFNYSWSMPSFRYQTQAERVSWSIGFSSYYVPAYQDEEFLILRRRDRR